MSRKLSVDEWNALDPEARARMERNWQMLRASEATINAIPESALAVAPVGLESLGSPKLVVLSTGGSTPVRGATADERAYAIKTYPKIKQLLEIAERGTK